MIDSDSATWAGTIAAFLTFILAFITLIRTLQSVRTAIDEAHYTELDKLYFEVLRMQKVLSQFRDKRQALADRVEKLGTASFISHRSDRIGRSA